MNRVIIHSILIAASFALPAAAYADGFVDVGGMAEGCHYASESVVAAYAADGAGTVHHGIIPANVGGDMSGIESVSDTRSISLSYDRATAALFVKGCRHAATLAVTGMDGRTVIRTAAGDGSVDLGSLAPGIYIVRVADTSASASIKIVR